MSLPPTKYRLESDEAYVKDKKSWKFLHLFLTASTKIKLEFQYYPENDRWIQKIKERVDLKVWHGDQVCHILEFKFGGDAPGSIKSGQLAKELTDYRTAYPNIPITVICIQENRFDARFRQKRNMIKLDTYAKIVGMAQKVGAKCKYTQPQYFSQTVMNVIRDRDPHPLPSFIRPPKHLTRFQKQLCLYTGVDETNVEALAADLGAWSQMFDSALSWDAYAVIDGFFGDTVENEPKLAAVKMLEELSD